MHATVARGPDEFVARARGCLSNFALKPLAGPLEKPNHPSPISVRGRTSYSGDPAYKYLPVIRSDRFAAMMPAPSTHTIQTSTSTMPHALPASSTAASKYTGADTIECVRLARTALAVKKDVHMSKTAQPSHARMTGKSANGTKVQSVTAIVSQNTGVPTRSARLRAARRPGTTRSISAGNLRFLRHFSDFEIGRASCRERV